MRRVVIILALLLLPSIAWAQPYAYSSLGTLSFNQGTYESHGAGSDLWISSWGANGNLYASYGDGNGWDLALPKDYFGVTSIPGNPPGLTGTDVYGDAQGGPNRKPLAFVATASGVMRGFYDTTTDSRDGNYVMTTSDNGATWDFTATKIFDASDDGVKVGGMLQADAGYATLPAHVSTSYYYVILAPLGNPPTGTDLWLARVPVGDIATRASYEYLSAIDGSNNASWSSTLGDKIAIFTNSESFEYHYTISMTWWPSIDSGNGRWILTTTHGTSNLGVFEAPRPWGPWKTLYYGTFRDAYRKFAPQTPQKWMSDCSTTCTLWLAWSGNPEYDSLNLVQGTLEASDTIAPKPPTALTVTTNSTSQLTYGWTPPTQNADDSNPVELAGYNIYTCDGAACTDWSLEASVALVTTYQDTGLTGATLYRVMIKARDGAGNLSAESELVEGRTASTVTLAMSGTATPNNWVNAGGATKMASVAAPDDDNTTYINSTTTSNTQQRFAVADATGTIGTADTILTVSAYHSARRNTTGTANYTITAFSTGGASTAVGGTFSAPSSANPYGDVTTAFNNPVGGAWNVTDLNALELMIQNTQSRDVRLTTLTVPVTYVPDPAPRAPSNPGATVLTGTSLHLSWTPPTTNADGSALSDLTSLQIKRCATASCIPDTDGTVIVSGLTAGCPSSCPTSYDDEDLTTGTTYSYQIYALDGTAKVSGPSPVIYATPSAGPTFVQGGFRFYRPGLATLQPLLSEGHTAQVRVQGAVRLLMQIRNTGAGASSQAFPLECNIAGQGYQTLTNTCSTSACMRALGGYAHGSTLGLVLTPPGSGTPAESRLASTATTPALPLPAESYGEMAYEIGIDGLTTEQVCCRPAGLHDYSAPAACFTVYPGSAQRG